MSEKPIKLLSDFDGTAVDSYKRNFWERCIKFGFPMIDGYGDFLDGAKSEGAEISALVTRRPNIAPVRCITEKSIASLGLNGYFSEEGSVIYAGSESKKAQYTVDQSVESNVGIVDNKILKMGREILHILASESEREKVDKRFIALGGVRHGRSGEDFFQFRDYAEGLAKASKGFSIKEFDYQASDSLSNVGYEIKIGRATLEVVHLANYSTDSGQAFTKMINEKSKPVVARVIGRAVKGAKSIVGNFRIIVGDQVRKLTVGNDNDDITVSLEDYDETDS